MKNINKEIIIFSNTARKHILENIKNKKENANIRISVVKQGCSGLSYKIDYVINPNHTDIIQYISKQHKIYIDKNSYPYIQGLYIDYVKINFLKKLIFHNPNNKGQCGCGESFSM